jgi:hypothetical protein
MSEHHVSVEVHAPVQQVYSFFSHFNDFPKFMSFVKEVTYYDEQRSHWVAQVGGTQEWDAVNEDWVAQRQIGWRSINGLENRGRVKFTYLGDSRTNVDVYISYVPPAGIVGEAVDRLGLDSHFDAILQEDLNRFASMVEEASDDALDPMQSHYLFHNDSAYARDMITDRQKEAMAHDSMMQPEALQQRDNMLHQQSAQTRQFEQERLTENERVAHEQRQAIEQQRIRLARQAELDREMEHQRPLESAINQSDPDPVHDTLGGRNASIDRTAFGDRDSRNERFPGHEEDPMTSRKPKIDGDDSTVSNSKQDSPWHNTIRGAAQRQERYDQQYATEHEKHAPSSLSEQS